MPPKSKPRAKKASPAKAKKATAKPASGKKAAAAKPTKPKSKTASAAKPKKASKANNADVASAATASGTLPAPIAPPQFAIDGPASPDVIAVLGPGASASFDHPLMVDLSAALIDAAKADGGRLAVMRFQFPKCGFKPEALMATFRGAVDLAKAQRPTAAANVVVGGRSMGGRYATHVADALGASAAVCFGYPFVPPGSPPKPPRTEHLPGLCCPTLIVQGDRDSFGGTEAVSQKGPVKAALDRSPAVHVTWIPSADHSLVPRPSVGTRASALAVAAKAAWDHIKRHSKLPRRK